MSSEKKSKEKETKSTEGIVIFSDDGDSIYVCEHDAKLSPLLLMYIKEGKGRIQLPITSCLLQKLHAYLEYHGGEIPPEIIKPIRYPEMSKNTNRWDACYIDDIAENPEELRILLLIANSLKIDSLVDLCCARMALMIKGFPLHVAVKNLRG